MSMNHHCLPSPIIIINSPNRKFNALGKKTLSSEWQPYNESVKIFLRRFQITSKWNMKLHQSLYRKTQTQLL